MKVRKLVKPLVNTADPMPGGLTLKELRKAPYNLWLRFIEHKIISMGTAPEDCWCYDLGGRNFDPALWYPQGMVSFNPFDKLPVYRKMNLRRYVARLFWDFPEHYIVYRNKNICTCFNCLRPSHLVIAPRGDMEAKFGT